MLHKPDRTEESYGFVPLKKVEGKWHVLLVQHGSAKYWGFPKGHAEAGESPMEAAERELKEETNLEVKRLLSPSALEEHYQFRLHGKLIGKTVYFFIAEVSGEVHVQAAEISGMQWVPMETAEKCVTYDTDKSICRSALRLLTQNKKFRFNA